MVGGGPLQAECEELIKELNLEGKFFLLGFRNDVASLLQILTMTAMSMCLSSMAKQGSWCLPTNLRLWPRRYYDFFEMIRCAAKWARLPNSVQAIIQKQECLKTWKNSMKNC